MSNGIAPLGSLQGTEPAITAGASSGVRSSATPFTAAETSITQAPLHPNPSFYIDASLGLVVMEFRSGSGGVSSTIPTSQQLEAYRRAAGTHHAGSAEVGTDPTNPIGTGNEATGSLNTGPAASTGSDVAMGSTVPAAPTSVAVSAIGPTQT